MTLMTSDNEGHKEKSDSPHKAPQHVRSKQITNEEEGSKNIISH